jgi:hypothetical protein
LRMVVRLMEESFACAGLTIGVFEIYIGEGKSISFCDPPSSNLSISSAWEIMDLLSSTCLGRLAQTADKDVTQDSARERFIIVRIAIR